MQGNASPQGLAAWGAGFPGQIPEKLVMAEELKGNVIDLEGRDVVVVELGHTDTDYTTCLHVPSIGLVVAGDAAYNDVHLYLVESSAQNRQEWIAALDKIESLSPRAVIASHKRPENDDSPRIIEETRKYIRDFDRLAGTTKTAQELYDQMLALYPTRVNPEWALWSSGARRSLRDGQQRVFIKVTGSLRFAELSDLRRQEAAWLERLSWRARGDFRPASREIKQERRPT